MLLPQELKKHQFHRSMNGYSAPEVEEHIEFIVSKYEALFRENDELERKLSAALRALDELRAREKQVAELEKILRGAAAQAEADARKKKEEIIRAAVAEADRITAEAEAYVTAQEDVQRRLRSEVTALRDTLFAAYSEHIDRIEQLTAIAAGETVSAEEETPVLDEIAEEIPMISDNTNTYAVPDRTNPFEPEEEEANESAQAETDAYAPRMIIDPFVPQENPVAQAETDAYTAQDIADFFAEETNKVAADEDVYTAEELFEEATEEAPTSLETVPFTVSEEDTYSQAELLGDEDLFAEAAQEDEDALLLKELHDAFVHSFDLAKGETGNESDLLEDDIMKALADAIGEAPDTAKEEDPFAFLAEDAEAK